MRTVSLLGLAGVALAAPPRYVPLDLSSGAACLDGSPYAYVICADVSAPRVNWTLNIQGGGWCYNETDCLERAGTRLGSSTSWPATAAAETCKPAPGTATVQLWYCDGASFSGYREAAWPVPGNASAALMFRGIRNLDATLDALTAHEGLADAQLLILTGGSAGGLSTFLHLDHVAARIAAVAPNSIVRGNPVCGFFIDSGNGGNAPPNVTYTLRMKYVHEMQNASGALSPACQQAHGADAWKCIMAPYAAPYIATPWFAFQSKFDHWQLANELMLPCMMAQPYAPPYKPSTCTAKEVAEIQAYGPAFMSQFSPLITAESKNGAFLDSCIIHGSTNSSIDGKNNEAAFQSWLSGGQHWYVALCNGSSSAGPCDPSAICAPL